MRVLLANDDGVEARGLAAAREALIAAGIGVVTVAPDRPRSGTARSATFRRPVSMRPHGGTDDNPIFAATGTPTDAVRVALLSGRLGAVDAVVSGINEGANLGDDATYSSTLGAAIEGALLGYPAISASQQTVDGRFRLIDLTGYDFAVGARVLAHLVRQLIDGRHEIPGRSVLNLNAPGKPAKAVRVVHFDERDWSVGTVHEVTGPTGEESGWMIFGTHPERDPVFRMQMGTDTWALSQGYAAVTPLNFRWGNRSALGRLNQWTQRAVTAVNRDLFAHIDSSS
ncbi:MAG: 5'/3'-nucleotidase SurE [Proteobacteria bacterium]|nr:5'/3'-nucleotidase SurE [Pseudomonadota bacterium]